MMSGLAVIIWRHSPAPLTTVSIRTRRPEEPRAVDRTKFSRYAISLFPADRLNQDRRRARILRTQWDCAVGNNIDTYRIW